jgi:hypothetical protein
MPVQWSISHPKRLVIAVAKGTVTADEIEDYLHGVGRQGGMPYGKLFEMADVANTLTPENIAVLGNIVRGYARGGKVGPLAIVAPIDRGYRQARLFANAAQAERPLAIFREWHEGRRWLDSMMSKDAAAGLSGLVASKQSQRGSDETPTR